MVDPIDSCADGWPMSIFPDHYALNESTYKRNIPVTGRNQPTQWDIWFAKFQIKCPPSVSQPRLTAPRFGFVAPGSSDVDFRYNSNKNATRSASFLKFFLP